MLEEALQVLELVQRLDQLLEVVEPAGGVGGLLGLPHVGVADLVEDALGELDMVDAAVADRGVPAVEAVDQLAERGPGARRQAAVADDQAGGASSSETPFARAVRLISCSALSPRPRLGTLTMRSKARSSSGETATRK